MKVLATLFVIWFGLLILCDTAMILGKLGYSHFLGIAITKDDQRVDNHEPLLVTCPKDCYLAAHGPSTWACVYDPIALYSHVEMF